MENIRLTSDMVCFQTKISNRFTLGLSFEAFIEMPTGEEIGTWISCTDFFGWLAENGEEEISPDKWAAHLNSGHMDNSFIAAYLNDRDNRGETPTNGEIEMHEKQLIESARDWDMRYLDRM